MAMPRGEERQIQADRVIDIESVSEQQTSALEGDDSRSRR